MTHRIILICCFFWTACFSQSTVYNKIETRSQKLPFGLTKTVPLDKPLVALVLSGGGARGLAQIGVLKAFEEAGIQLDIIVGTSMGSIVGGLYAAGYSAEDLDSIARSTNWNELLSTNREADRRELFVDQKITEDKAIFALRLEGLTPILPTSINDGQKLLNYLNLLTFQAPIHVKTDFDDLKVKFRAVCTDLLTGAAVQLSSGSLSQAMRASSSVSFLLSPVKIDSLLLVDGGLVANIPVKIAKDAGANFIIAVNTTSDLHTEEELSFPWIVADQVVSIPLKIMNQEQLKYADEIIKPNLYGRDANDFTNIDSLILAGYLAAKPLVDSIIKKINDSSSFENEIQTGDNKVFILANSPGGETFTIDRLRQNLKKEFENGIMDSIRYRFINEDSVEVFFSIKSIVSHIELDGITVIDKDSVRVLMNDLLNLPFNPDKIVERIILVLKKYRKAGYSLAELRRLKFDEKSGELYFLFDEGVISEIKIEGNEHTNPYIIRREFPLNVGEHFKYKNIEQGLINLRSTNLFENVTVDVKKNNELNVLILRVQEKIPGIVRFGFRLDNEYRAQLSLDIRNENIFGSATELGLLLSGGARNRNYVFEHKANRLFNTYFTYKINAFYRFNDVIVYRDDPAGTENSFTRSDAGEYRQIFYGASFSTGTQVGKFGNLILQTKYQLDEIKNKRGSSISPYMLNIFSFKISATVDTQNKYPYPDYGLYFTGFYESAQKILGGDVGFTNFEIEYKNYFSIAEDHLLAPRVIMGFADKTLPLSEQYSIGGQNSFFGMREDEFRGRQVFIASLEYRYKLPVKIFFETYFKIRYDLGSAWDEQEQIRFKDLRHGLGTTLSFDTPIGPADFSIGKSFLFKKNLPGNPISTGETFFYFSIGFFY